jgi:kynurenine formamidase
MLHDDSYFIKNPGLSEAAAKYLVSKKTNLVGIDSPSIDFKGNKRFSVHRIFSKNNILIVENLANLEKIKSSKFHFVVLPLKLKGATGSPVRAIAFVN